MTKFLTLLALLLPMSAYGLTVTCDTGEVYRSTKVTQFPHEVTPKLASRFIKALRDTARAPGDRIIVIDSNGGDVEVGNAMLAAMGLEQKLGVRVVCIVDDEAHSMAFNFLTHCDVRLATAGATMLVHKVRMWHVENATAKDLRKMATELDEDDEPFRIANAEAMKLDLQAYDGFADKETTWKAATLRKRGYLHGVCTVTN